MDSDGSIGDRKGDEPPRDDDKKVVREQERRFANNARERFVSIIMLSLAYSLLFLRVCGLGGGIGTFGIYIRI